jgi:hypothetical protein
MGFGGDFFKILGVFSENIFERGLKKRIVFSNPLF